jgi:hypothetical protein
MLYLTYPSTLYDAACIIASGSKDLVAAINVFFDESIGRDGQILAVGAYIFRKSRLKQFDRDWRLLLVDYELPFFRMSLCAHDGLFGEFRHLNPKQCDTAARRAIALIKKYAQFGAAIAVDCKRFREVIPKNPYLSTPYQFCMWVLLRSIGVWCTDSFAKARIAYFSEAGHSDQAQTEQMMRRVFKRENLREACKYAGHSFITKESAYALQAADVLAWHAYKESARLLDGEQRPRRKDFSSLTEMSHYLCFPRDEILMLYESALQMAMAQINLPADASSSVGGF